MLPEFDTNERYWGETMRKLIGPVAAAVLAISALGAPSASAATEVGDNCVANNEFSSPVTFFEAAAPANPLPIAVPSSGVLTSWKVSVIPVPFTIPQTLKVLRLNTTSNTALVVGETPANIVSGLNVINARIPVQAGDRLSIFGPGPIETLICSTPGEESLIGGFTGNGGGVGSSNLFIELPEEFRVPVAAVIEPDADSDGFGDETQDKCLQNAAVQVACPVVALSGSVAVRKGLAKVLVTSNIQAPVTVAGKVTLGKGKTANLNGGTQVVTPGTIAKFTILFPARLKERLKSLSRKQSLTLALTATAPNVVGSPTTSKLKAKVKGQKKPVRKGKGGKGKGR